MLATPHILVGTAIGKHIKQPYIALPLAFASHFVLDAIPHVDTVSVLSPGSVYVRPLIAADLVLGFALLFLLTLRQRRTWWMVLASLMAIGPDVMVGFCDIVPFWSRLPGIWTFVRLHGANGSALPTAKWVLGTCTQIAAMTAGAVFVSSPEHSPVRSC